MENELAIKTAPLDVIVNGKKLRMEAFDPYGSRFNGFGGDHIIVEIDGLCYRSNNVWFNSHTTEPDTAKLITWHPGDGTRCVGTCGKGCDTFGPWMDLQDGRAR